MQNPIRLLLKNQLNPSTSIQHAPPSAGTRQAATHGGEHRHPAILQFGLAAPAEGLQVAVLDARGPVVPAVEISISFGDLVTSTQTYMAGKSTLFIYIIYIYI